MDPIVAKRRYVLQVIELVPSFKMPVEEHQPTEANSAPADTGEDTALADVAAEARAIPASAPPQRVPNAPPSRASSDQQVASQARPLAPRRRVAPPRDLKQPVDALSYAAISAQVVLFVVLVVGFLFAFTRVALPYCREVIAQQFGAKSSKAIIKSLTPVFWFMLGYMFVAALRSKVSGFEIWQLLHFFD